MTLSRCPVPGCTTVSDQPFMCRNHWRFVPKELQAKLRAGEDVLDEAIAAAVDRERLPMAAVR